MTSFFPRIPAADLAPFRAEGERLYRKASERLASRSYFPHLAHA